jgi:hypothetical protein
LESRWQYVGKEEVHSSFFSTSCALDTQPSESEEVHEEKRRDCFSSGLPHGACTPDQPCFPCKVKLLHTDPIQLSKLNNYICKHPSMQHLRYVVRGPYVGAAFPPAPACVGLSFHWLTIVPNDTGLKAPTLHLVRMTRALGVPSVCSWSRFILRDESSKTENIT